MAGIFDPGLILNDTHHATPPSTLLDVARQAGVSPSTVSRILNGTARVSDDKRDAVLGALSRRGCVTYKTTKQRSNHASICICFTTECLRCLPRA